MAGAWLERGWNMAGTWLEHGAVGTPDEGVGVGSASTWRKRPTLPSSHACQYRCGVSTMLLGPKAARHTLATSIGPTPWRQVCPKPPEVTQFPGMSILPRLVFQNVSIAPRLHRAWLFDNLAVQKAVRKKLRGNQPS
eukprot:365137-Chlamydomonas_euryale.AAC.9